MKLDVTSLIIEFKKYVSVGLVMTTGSLITFYVTLEILTLPLYPTYITVYIIAIYISYLLNSKYTFNKEKNVSDGLRYYLVYLLGMLIGIGLLALFKTLFSVSNFVLILLILVPRTLITYILSKFFVFKK